MRRRLSTVVLTALTAAGLVMTAGPASADHTDPNTPLAPTETVPPPDFLTTGEGTWQYIDGLAANPGSDLKFFTKGGDIYASSGTLGQGDIDFVGQRIVRLVDDGTVAPVWVADHGSAHCTLRSTSVTGLQHDAAVTPATDPGLLVDTTDASGRCHDPNGGGLELIDISGLGQEGFEVRELHLVRHRGSSHTVTADPARTGIFYNSTSDSNTANLWIDIVDARSCLGTGALEAKRDACRPTVHRLSWEDHPEWSQRRKLDGTLEPGSESACHDITVVGSRLYCAGLNASLIFDVGRMFARNGTVRGATLPCTLTDGTGTGAKVTDCSQAGPGSPLATGYKFLGTFNHPGRPPGQQNNNLEVPSDEGVSVSHESDPTPDAKFLLVTDERGGGVVPPGASCTQGLDNPFGNGGIHVFDIGDPSNIQYAQTPDGEKAIWRGEVVLSSESFCTVHVIHQIPDEARLFMGYYSQGIKILDYSVNKQGQWTFDEVASAVLPESNTWVAQPFLIQDNGDGTRTYFIMTSDIERGIDILTWTGRIHRLKSGGRGTALSSVAAGDASLLLLGLVILPAAAQISRRRRRNR
jgi:hypothetical protein